MMPDPKQIVFRFVQYDQSEGLAEADRDLIAVAHDAAGRAYAPYSKFKVGAALRLENGTVVIGSNQENASYPAGICAERTALHAAMSQWPDQKVMEMAIVVPSASKDRPVSPCGICRQALLEQEYRQKAWMRLLMAVPGGTVYEMGSAADLLPLSFDGSFLKP